MKRLAVIGGGVIGLATAFRFIKEGWRVCLYDPNPHINASHACLGVSTMKGQSQPIKPLFTAKYHGHCQLPAWLELIKAASNKEIPYSFSGVLEPYSSEEGAQKIIERVFHSKFQGAKQSRLETLAQVREKLGSANVLHKEVTGGFYYPKDGWFDPEALLHALRRIVENSGDIVLEKVEAIAPNAKDELVIEAGGNRKSFDQVIAACGPQSKDIFQMLAVPLPPLIDLPGASFSWQIDCDAERPYAICFGKYNLRHQGRQLHMGSTSWQTKEEAAAGCDAERFVSEHLPLFSREWTAGRPPTVRQGVRVRTKDRCPIFVSLPCGKKKVFVATGFYKNGFQLAAGAAAALWALAHRQVPEYPYDQFVNLGD